MSSMSGGGGDDSPAAATPAAPPKAAPATAKAPSDIFDGLFGDLPEAKPAAAVVKKEEPPGAAAGQQGEEEGKKRKATAGAGAEAGAGGGGQQQQKRPREGEGEGKGGGGATVDLEVALQKISAALRSSKAEKFRKAGELLVKLMADMDAANCGHFHSALAFFMAEEGSWERLVGSVEDRALSEKLFGALQQRILLLSPEAQYRAASWVLLGGIRPRLLTDDSFAFRRAVRELKEYVTCLQPYLDAAAGGTPADAERRRAVLAALATALKRGLLFAWAKPSVEEVFALATERRLQVFSEAEREELDEMATQLRAARHGQSVNPNGGSSVVSRSVRLANSMSTPWNRKSGDVFR